MSGIEHSRPFRHYHRQEDGTTYFAINGVIHSAPTERDACKFDVDGGCLTIQDWETPSEFEPFRHEVESALGLPLTPLGFNPREKVRDAINAMNCEWRSDYDYPDFLSVYPRVTGTAVENDDGIHWSFGVTNGPWGGNDRLGDNGVHWEDLPADSEPELVANRIVTFMREQALKRVGWLNDFIGQCITHIEKTSATSPETTGGPWAIVKGMPAYEEAQKLISTWRQS